MCQNFLLQLSELDTRDLLARRSWAVGSVASQSPDTSFTILEFVKGPFVYLETDA